MNFFIIVYGFDQVAYYFVHKTIYSFCVCNDLCMKSNNDPLFKLSI